MSLFKKLKQIIEWPTKLSATMGPQSSRATVPSRPQLRLVSKLTPEQIDAARHTPEGLAIAAAVSNFSDRSDAPQKPIFDTGIQQSTLVQSSETPTPPAPPKKSWGSLRARFKTRADLVNAKVQEIKKGNVRGVLREAFKPVAAFGLTYGLKHAGKIAATLVPGGIFIGATIGAAVGVGITLTNMWRKGELTRENLLTRKTGLKLIFSGISGAVGGALGVDAADGFEHIQRFGSFLKDTFAPVALPIPDAARVAARAASSAARAASASVAQAVTSSGAAQTVAQSTGNLAARVRELQEADQIRTAKEYAARMAAKTKVAAGKITKKIAPQAPSVPKWQQVREAWKANDAQGGSGTEDWVKTSVSPTPPLPDPSNLPGSTLVESSTLPQPSAITAPHAAVSTPAPQVPVAAMNTPSHVADAAAPSGDAHVLLKLAEGAEVSGPAPDVLSLQEDLAAAAAPAKQFSDGSILTAVAGVSTDPPDKILGGDVLRPTRGYATGEDQFAHAGGGVGRGATFSPAH